MLGAAQRGVPWNPRNHPESATGVDERCHVVILLEGGEHRDFLTPLPRLIPPPYYYNMKVYILEKVYWTMSDSHPSSPEEPPVDDQPPPPPPPPQRTNHCIYQPLITMQEVGFSHHIYTYLCRPILSQIVNFCWSLSQLMITPSATQTSPVSTPRARNNSWSSDIFRPNC